MREENTKENPGCICSMRRYLSEISGLPTTYTEIRSYEEVTLPTKHGNRRFKYSSYHLNFIIDGEEVGFIHKEQRKGGVWVWTNGKRDFPFDSDLSQIKVTFVRSIHDFGIRFIDHGKTYNDSLGGGWYAKVKMYQVNEFYFANMECACR